MIWIDLTDKNLDGWTVAWALEAVGIICNRQTVPSDKRSAYFPSGLRLGTPALTTRGMKEKEMVLISGWINDVISHLQKMDLTKMDSVDKDKNKLARQEFKKQISKDRFLLKIKNKVLGLCRKFPVASI